MSALSDLHARYDGPIPEHERDAAMRADTEPPIPQWQHDLRQLIVSARLLGRMEERALECSKVRQGAAGAGAKALVAAMSKEIEHAERLMQTHERSISACEAAIVRLLQEVRSES